MLSELSSATPIVFSSLSAGDTYFVIGDFPEATCIQIQVWWDGLNSSDGKIQLVYRNSLRVPKYIERDTLKGNLSSPSGSIEIIHYDFRSREVAIKISKGSNTSGTLSYWLMAR